MFFCSGFRLFEIRKLLSECCGGLGPSRPPYASMKLGLSGELKAAFPNTIPVPRRVVDQVSQNPNWPADFAESVSNFTICVAF